MNRLLSKGLRDGVWDHRRCSSAPRKERHSKKEPFGLITCHSHDDSAFMFEKQFLINAKDQYLNYDMFVDLPSQDLALSRWTRVSDDDRLMNHLLRMLFTWDNIVERTLYRPLLEEDIASMDPASADGDSGSFCTRFLISALLAASCVSPHSAG